MSSISAYRIAGRFDLGGVLMISARINGQKTELMLDSGAAMTGINQKFAEYFGIRIDPVHKVRVIAAHDNPLELSTGLAKEFRVGGVIRQNLPVLIIPFPSTSDLHGIIGMNFLQGLRFTVEMDTGTLILREMKKS